MGINIRQKGAEGEREIVKLLTPIIVKVMTEMAFPPEQITAAEKMVQRNQNQSAVGGNDLSNTFGMSIEVKRQEQLAINTWWDQCVTAANRNNELPVLMWRQNGKKWNVRTYVWLALPHETNASWRQTQAIANFDIETFKTWFEAWVRSKLLAGYEIKV